MNRAPTTKDRSFMAQAYKSGSETDPANATDPQRPGFHYYSGGEVKELENTRVSPLLWAFWSVVIAAAVGYLFYGGALGPHVGGGFKPTSGSAASLAAVQTDLNKQAYAGGEGAKQADMTQLMPFLGGESLNTAIAHGSNTYQNYCIGCHGPNQDGNGVNASSLNPKPRNLHDGPFMRETLNYQRINTSLHYGVHGTAMPRWENTLTEHEIQEVIAYVLSLTWNMPTAGTDTTTSQLATPPGRTQPDATSGMASPGKSVTGSKTGTAGGVFVRGAGGGAASISNSPKPITPVVEGNPAAATSTAPPSQSGQPAAAGAVNTNAPDSAPTGPKTPPSVTTGPATPNGTSSPLPGGSR